MDYQSNKKNWKCGIAAFTYFHQGIGEFAEKAVAKEHARILMAREIRPEQRCTQCNLSNLKPLHSSIEGRNVCPYRQPNCNCIHGNKSSCPIKVCDAIYEEILKAHHSTLPIHWKNTDIKKWTSNPWEVAKCFIKTYGYADKENASDIDVSGILQIFINNINLRDCLSEAQQTLLRKMRNARNTLVHSSSMTFSKDEFNMLIDDMLSILYDEKNLRHNDMAKEAVCNLIKLKDEIRDIGCAFCSTPVRLKDVRHLESGQHISFERKKGTFTHHAIVTKVNRQLSKTCAEVEIIHFSKVKRIFKVIKETQMIDLKKSKIKIVEYEHRRYSADETVRRAEEVLAGVNSMFNSYDFIFRNCEHLANWCIVGGMVSLQVDELIKTFSNTFLESSMQICHFALQFTIAGFVTVGALIFFSIIFVTFVDVIKFGYKQMCKLCLKRNIIFNWLNFTCFLLMSALQYMMSIYFDHLHKSIHLTVFLLSVFLLKLCGPVILKLLLNT